MMKLSLILLFSSHIYLASTVAFAAACCGGGFAAPTLIAGDDKAQLTTSYSYSQYVADVYTSGLWKKREDNESDQTFRFEGAHIFQDLWQAGISIPFTRKSNSEVHASGVGDTVSTLGYEYLSDWDYHPLRPKGIGFIQLTMPTGKSIYETDPSTLENRGRGFWTLGIGTLLTKVLSRWDAFLSLELHKSFAKSVEKNGAATEIQPGWGANPNVGIGFNTVHFRYGASIGWSYEDRINLSGAFQSKGSPQRFATATAAISYLANDEWAGTLSYSDQTLIGAPANTTLGKTASLQIQRRWAR